jgi:hypothetical protein
LSQGISAVPFWQRFDVLRIEDFENLVLGASAEAIQMDRAPVRGSLAFSARDGVVFSTGLINSRIAIRGQLSQDAISLVVGLRLGSGSRLWLNEVRGGGVSVVLPRETFDALFTSASFTIPATLSVVRLREETSRLGIPLDRRMIAETGLHQRPLSPRVLEQLRRQVETVHTNGPIDGLGRDPQRGRIAGGVEVGRRDGQLRPDGAIRHHNRRAQNGGRRLEAWRCLGRHLEVDQQQVVAAGANPPADGSA